MKNFLIFFFISDLFFSLGYAQPTSVYCPKNHGYISLGMTQSQVLSACGIPDNKLKGKEPWTIKMPMMQLIYNSQGSSKAFYGVWTLQVGVNSGTQLAIDVVDNKVHAVRVSDSNNKAFSLCAGIPILVGDPVTKVYNACGTPSTINNTYITKPMEPVTYPEYWSYSEPYQPTIRLTFINGKLQSFQ